ncbi:MAG TPA: FGGY family carbohydrate kinase [Terracidiphilus sp.]|nr:FGGY family carbohydrate kinase [Terracidiphilus sp.]
MQERARVAIDLGAESCRVSLLSWVGGKPKIEVIHRIPNGPIHRGASLHWPLDKILAGLEDGLRKASQAAPEGIASIGVDSWGVDYVRLAPDGSPLREPFCYRDERTVASKEAADLIIPPFEIYQRTGVFPMRLNTVYQLLADLAAGIDPHVPWVMMPEFILHWLGAQRVSEYTQATHTGLVDLKTRDWSPEVFRMLGIPIDAAPPIVHAGTVVGHMRGPLAALDAFRETELIVPACHDTASAIAGIPTNLGSAAYISSGTWSLVGTLTTVPVTTRVAFDSGYTNLGAVTGDLMFHSLINSMWVLKQCMDGWAAQGRAWKIEDIVQQAGACNISTRLLDMDAESLMLDSEMPQRINNELTKAGFEPIPDVAGNEPIFARLIFESLSMRYAAALASLEKMLGRRLSAIHMLGGANRNKLLVQLTEQRTGLPVEIGETESSTIGSLAVQLASSDAGGQQIRPEAVREWAKTLCLR